MEMSLEEFKYIQRFLAQSSGIVLSDVKQYLVKNRLSGLVFQYGMSSFSELISALQTNSSASTKIKADVIDAMTTNETFWFRDDAQFTELKQNIIPNMLAEKINLRIWSAACSSGQEPYTISMCLEDLPSKDLNFSMVRIFATDISEKILQQAKRAVYNESSLSRGVDSSLRNRFFKKTEEGYALVSEIKNRVRFQHFNLLKPFSSLGRFDIIFCRNVLIYFSETDRKSIISRMLEVLEPGGVIFLSSTEVIPDGINGYTSVRGNRCRFYKKESS